MTDFSFLIDNMNFSYSSATSFQQCPRLWYLTYIMGYRSIDNFYSQFGRFVHLILEKYFRRELDCFTAPEFYDKKFDEFIKSPEPPNTTHRKFGMDFFSGIHFDRAKYDVISIEPYTKMKDGDVWVVVRPDIILREKETGQILLLDYKTSSFHHKTGTVIKKKFDGYSRQALLYAYYMNRVLDKPIDKIFIWSIRLDKLEEVMYNEALMMLARHWFLTVVGEIKREEQWSPRPEDFFCNNLCGVKNHCPIFGE